jgi:hypothetical protein
MRMTNFVAVFLYVLKFYDDYAIEKLNINK